MNIYLKNTIIDDLQFTDSDLALYIALKSLYQSSREEQVISLNMIMYELYGSTGFKRSSQEKISESFQKFIDKELIIVKAKFSSSEYVLDLKKFYLDGMEDYYTMIRDTEVHAIMNISNKMDKFKLLRYYIVCLESICKTVGVYENAMGHERTNFVGFMPKAFLCEKIGVNYALNNKLVQQYDSVLEEHHLLYIHRHKELKRDKVTGQITSFTNHYGRYEDKEFIEQFAKQYKKECGVQEEIVQSEKANEKRSLMQKYNNLLRDFSKYSVLYPKDVLAKMYEHVHNENKKIMDIMEHVSDDSYYYMDMKRKLRDESVFQKIPGLWFGDAAESTSSHAA